MKMYVFSAATLQDFECSFLMGGIVGPHPQQQTALANVLFEMPGMRPSDQTGERCTHSSPGSAGERGDGYCAEKSPARSRNSKTADNGWKISGRGDDAALGGADRLVRHITNPGGNRIIFELGRRLIRSPQLGDGLLTGQHT